MLIVDLDKYIGSARAWRDTFAEQLPDLEIRIWPDAPTAGRERAGATPGSPDR